MPVAAAGDPSETIPALVKESGAGLLVTDFAPLRLGRQWREAVRLPGWRQGLEEALLIGKRDLKNAGTLRGAPAGAL